MIEEMLQVICTVYCNTTVILQSCLLFSIKQIKLYNERNKSQYTCCCIYKCSNSMNIHFEHLTTQYNTKNLVGAVSF